MHNLSGKVEDKGVRILNRKIIKKKITKIAKFEHFLNFSIIQCYQVPHKALCSNILTQSLHDAIPDSKSHCEMTGFTLQACTHPCQWL